MMKNHLFKTAMLLCAVAVLGACNKDKATGPSPNADNLQANDPIEQLRTFRTHIKAVQSNPDMRNDETIALADALWCVENNFNLTYSDAEQYYSQLTDHEFILYLPVNENHEVTVYDAVSLYSQTVNQARDAIASDPFNEKGFVSLTIATAEEEDDMVRVTFTGRTGERSSYNPPTAHVDGPFGDDDNWMFAYPLGKCDDPDIPSGADKQLQEKLFDALIGETPEANPGYRNVYLNRIRFIFDGTNNPGIYYTQNPDEICIDHYSMNDYFYGEKRMISQTIPETHHLNGYSPISIEISGWYLDNPSAVTHHNEIEYGIRMEVSTEEFGEIENILL